MEQGIIQGVRKIAFFRPSALGDFIFALPALDALSCTYPQAEIVYLGRDWHASYLAGRTPAVRRVIPIPNPDALDVPAGYITRRESLAPIQAQLRAEHFDLAIQANGAGVTSNPFVLGMAPQVSIGLKSPAAPPLDRWIDYQYEQNEVIRLLEVAHLCGASVPSSRLEPRLPVLASDFEAADAAAGTVAELSNHYVVIHAGSTDSRRCWSEEGFARVADYCVHSLGFAVVFTGMAYERERVGAVVRQMKTASTNLCGRLTLAALTGVIARSTLMISNDTGPLHLALAVGTRAVGLFWSEYAIHSLPLSRRAFIPLISRAQICSLCGRPYRREDADFPYGGHCIHDVSFMREIQVDEVIAAVDQVLALAAF